jgi:hypothetical protein
MSLLFGALNQGVPPPPMKTKNPLILAAFVAGLSMAASAFTLDAVGYEGGELSLNPAAVSVPGYGMLIFESALGMPLVVNSGYENADGVGDPLLKFDPNDSVKITFDGTQLLNVDFYFGGLSDGESFEVQSLPEAEIFTPQAFLVTLKAGGDGADLHAIRSNTQSVPETSATLLGMMGIAAFAFRRRR